MSSSLRPRFRLTAFDSDVRDSTVTPRTCATVTFCALLSLATFHWPMLRLICLKRRVTCHNTLPVPNDRVDDVGIVVRHEMALELASGADLCCIRLCKTSPVFLEGPRGQVCQKSGPQNPTHIYIYKHSGTQCYPPQRGPVVLPPGGEAEGGVRDDTLPALKHNLKMYISRDRALTNVHTSMCTHIHTIYIYTLHI